MSERLYSVTSSHGYVVRCNVTYEKACEWLAASAGEGVYDVVEQKPVVNVVQGDAGNEPSLKRFATYLLGRASESKVYRDKAAKEWRYSCAQEHQVAIDIYEELADFILSGDAKKEL